MISTKSFLVTFLLIIAMILTSFSLEESHAVNYNKNKKDSLYVGLQESNAKNKLDLLSVYGDTDAYHPDILYFANGWNGYKYWLVFTPFPRNDSSKENPHIKVSNDLLNWEVPYNTPNPLDVAKGFGVGTMLFNSDAELVYNNDLDRIECFWRRWTISGEILYMRYTYDGSNWSGVKEVYSVSRLGTNPNKLLSPTIVYENGTYKMWYANNYGDWVVVYEEFDSIPFNKAKDHKVFTFQTKDSKLYSWHLDVIKRFNRYEMLLVATDKLNHKYKHNEEYMSLYYLYSKDNENWSNAVKIISPSEDPTAWDNRGIYRSSMFVKNGVYYVFYSASNYESDKGTSILYGSEITELTPLFE